MILWHCIFYTLNISSFYLLICWFCDTAPFIVWLSVDLTAKSQWNRLALSLLECIWCFLSFIKIRVIYRDPTKNITVDSIERETKLKRIDIIGLSVSFIVLTVGISVFGADICGDIALVSKDCPDAEHYPFDRESAEKISGHFNVLHITYWTSMCLVFMYMMTMRYLLKSSSNKTKWIKRINDRWPCWWVTPLDHLMCTVLWCDMMWSLDSVPKWQSNWLPLPIVIHVEIVRKRQLNMWLQKLFSLNCALVRCHAVTFIIFKMMQRAY